MFLNQAINTKQSCSIKGELLTDLARCILNVGAGVGGQSVGYHADGGISLTVRIN